VSVSSLDFHKCGDDWSGVEWGGGWSGVGWRLDWTN
ncbi:MAG: hypothetical protein ACI90V_003089, partial [Bacillariaceae sp.]